MLFKDRLTEMLNKAGVPSIIQFKVAKMETGKKTSPTPKVRAVIQIELLGGTRYKGENRFFLVNWKEPAQTLEEVGSH